MPRRAEDSHGIKRDRPGMRKLRLYLAESRIRVGKQMNSAKPQMPGMPDDVSEGKSARPALQVIHPVAGPGIFANIAVAAGPDKEAIKRVIQNRQPDADQL